MTLTPESRLRAAFVIEGGNMLDRIPLWAATVLMAIVYAALIVAGGWLRAL